MLSNPLLQIYSICIIFIIATSFHNVGLDSSMHNPDSKLLLDLTCFLFSLYIP